MTEEKLTPERAVSLLRAKAAELEAYVKEHEYGKADFGSLQQVTFLSADVALVAGLLADHIEDLILGGDLPPGE